jgi:hypothetical protein
MGHKKCRPESSVLNAHVDINYVYKGEGRIVKSNKLRISIKLKLTLHVSAYLYNSHHKAERYRMKIIHLLCFVQFLCDLL